MADKASELHDILDKGVDYKNRRIYFGGGDDGAVSWTTVENVVRALHKLSADHPKTPIELHMSSSGGDAVELLRLYDQIQSCSCQIKFFGSGQISSSAVWIMAGCDERWLHPNTSVMIHHGSLSNGQHNYTDYQIENDESIRDNYRGTQILADNSRMPVEFWDEILQRDLYLTPEEAIKLGIADKIVEPKKRGNLRKTRAHSLKNHPEKRDLTKLVKHLHKRIHKGRNITKLEIHIPKDQYDKNIVIDTTPLEEEGIDNSPAVEKNTQSNNTNGGISLSKLRQEQNGKNN